MANLRMLRRFVELVATAFVSVASPILTAAVDAVCVVVFVLTIWELWTPAKTIAEAFLARYGVS
jgi:hypothetical protein